MCKCISCIPKYASEWVYKLVSECSMHVRGVYTCLYMHMFVNVYTFISFFCQSFLTKNSALLHTVVIETPLIPVYICMYMHIMPVCVVHVHCVTCMWCIEVMFSVCVYIHIILTKECNALLWYNKNPLCYVCTHVLHVYIWYYTYLKLNAHTLSECVKTLANVGVSISNVQCTCFSYYNHLLF
jgi:hypothetical protein